MKIDKVYEPSTTSLRCYVCNHDNCDGVTIVSWNKPNLRISRYPVHGVCAMNLTDAEILTQIKRYRANFFRDTMVVVPFRKKRVRARCFVCGTYGCDGVTVFDVQSTDNVNEVAVHETCVLPLRRKRILEVYNGKG